ncbi:MAG: YfhO family protein [Steroidobacteraceae bacterium]|jgi:hypothetical protein|nr:YfhO family protein [Steroidobacteraceae bacterium]
MKPGPSPVETERLAQLLPILLVAAACLFNLLAYAAELVVAAPPVNDDVFHLGLAGRMNAAWEAGGNPLDTWIGYWGQGFPVLRYYQHLPHFVTVLVHRLSGGYVSLPAAYDGLRVLLLALLPLSFYLGARRLGAARLAAACVALCVPLLAADPAVRHFLGFQPRSFLWSGAGMFPQLFAMVLFPLALGGAVRTALGGRGYAPAIAWLAATWLSHLVLGYTACLLGLLVLLHPEASGQRARVALRLAAIYLGTALVASYLLLPTLLESQWLSRSAWEPAEYWDSYGAPQVLAALVGGGLLDGNRFPVLTLLAGLGAAFAAFACLDRQRPDRGFAIVALGIFALGLMLFFGRPTWGRALELLPFSASLPFHRFICAVQAGGILLAGFALARLAERLDWSRNNARAALAGMAALVLLSPAFASTGSLAISNARWRAEAAKAWAAEGGAVDRALSDFAALDRASPGRGYAGASWDWGRDFRVGSVNVYHRWTVHELPAISYMYHTMGLASDLEPYFDPWRRDHHDLFNVRYRLADASQDLPPFAQPRAADPDIAAGVVETEGYFSVVGSAGFFPRPAGDAAMLREFNRAFIAGQWHAADWFVRIGLQPTDSAAPGEIALAPGGPFDFDDPPRGAAPRGRVPESGGAGDVYRARVLLEEPGIVLFRMAYHPHWQALLGGRPVPTFMLSPGYVGVHVPPGEHQIVMTYSPPGWTTWARWTGFAILALVGVAERAGRRSARAAETPSRAGARFRNVPFV